MSRGQRHVVTSAELTPSERTAGARVLSLDAGAAVQRSRTGGKAAALAVARRAGLPTLPGLVLTTDFAADVAAGADVRQHPAVAEVFRRLRGGSQALVVRSSSVVEDGSGSSYAGRFTSVIGVCGAAALADAVELVLASAAGVDEPPQPMAVLVQPLLEATVGGVLFGVDPVTGRTDRRVVAAGTGAPERLVSGEVTGSRYETDPWGRRVAVDRGDGPRLSRLRLRRLAALSERAAVAFGGPQDVEWAFDRSNGLWLLQSRPVTTPVRGVPDGPVYGPGPVAETLPAPLSRLEQDLWVPPLREAVREAVAVQGAISRRRLRRSEVVVVVDDQVAVDLGVVADGAGRIASRLDPRPAARALRSAWRTGRLRAALPLLADAVLERVDADLGALPPLDALSDLQLATVLRRSEQALRSIHAHEMLIGSLLTPGSDGPTASAVALRALAEGRAAGLDDAALVERDPVVLALVPPAVGPSAGLPRSVAPDPAVLGAAGAVSPPGGAADAGFLREALRLRARWVQELTARAAWELGTRFARADRLATPDAVRHVPLEAVLAAAVDPAVVLRPEAPGAAARPLPARFRLTDLDQPVEVGRRRGGTGGVGAGGGLGSGVVTRDRVDPPPGAVLVTTTLSPALAPLLPRLGGLVAETGSVLSHLAILAREAGVPTVVGAPGAAGLADGTLVAVDGERGTVTPVAGTDEGGGDA